MAIDRTAFNALIDDTGDNLTGTTVTKAVIETVLLDPIDVALALGGFGGDLNPATHSAAIVAPVDSQFAWVNQGGASLRDDATSVVLLSAALAVGSPTNYQIRVKTAPTPPYVVTVHLLPLIIAKTYLQYGLLFRESSSGKLHALTVLGDGTRFVLYSTKLNSATTTPALADYKQLPLLGSPVPHWLQIRDDGINRECALSADGVDWWLFDSVARTNFLTADQVGFFVAPDNTDAPALSPILRVSSWKET